jgi:hypothetical protein
MILVLVGACSESEAPQDPSHKVIQLSQTGVYEHFHSLSLSTDGRMAWVGDLDEQSDLFLLPISGLLEIQITDMDYASIMTNDAGWIVWQGFDGNDAEIFLYSNGKLVQITQNDTEDAFPWINNAGQIVWTGSDGEDLEIFLYENGTATQITNNTENDVHPQINDAGQILWWGGQNSGLFVFLYDKGVVIQLSPDSVEYYDRKKIPSVQLNIKGQAVWTARTKGDTEIFWFNGMETSQITANTHDDIHPAINAFGQIVWQGFDGNDFEIFTFQKGSVQQITDNDTDDVFPAVNAQGVIVWQGDGPDGSGIYLNTSGQITRVSPNGMDAFDPKISDNQRVAWMTREWDEAWKHTGVYLAVPQSVTIPPENLDPSVRELPGISRQKPPSGTPSLSPAFVMPVPRPPHNPQDPFSFVVMGDSRGKDISWVVGERMNREFLRFIVDRIVNEIKPQLVIFNGDMATMARSISGHRYLPDWINLVKPITDAGILLYVVKGNHELYTFYGAFRKSYQDEYQAYFSNMQGITSLEGYKNLAFSFEFANSYFVIFDSFFSWKAPWYKISDYHYYGNIGDTQLAWLKQQAKTAAKSGAAHFFAISHAPVFSAEGTPEIPFYMMTQAWKTFTQNDFDLYFGAHEHIYSRKVIEADQDKGFANALAQTVTGAAGASTDPEWRIKVDIDLWNVHLVFNYVVVNVAGNNITATAYGVSNDLSQTWEIDKYALGK